MRDQQGAGQGAYPKKMVPDALAAVLSSGSSDIAAYAVLDATHILGLPEMLDASGLEHRCLFLSDDDDTTPESAPWLERLEATANFTRNIFTAGPAPWHLWTSEPCLILLSKLNLQDLWRHLRKFSRVSLHGRLGQRDGTEIKRDVEMAGKPQSRIALHRAGQAYAERSGR